MMSIRDIFQNCLDVQETEDGYCPRRCTDSQIAYYKNAGDVYRNRAVCNAGATMSFYTDASTISFDFKIKTFSRPRVVFDVYEDGILTQSDRFEEELNSGTITYNRIKTTQSKITIYLPYMCETWISNLNLGDFTPVDRTRCKKYLALGDSITEGMLSEFTSITYTSIIERDRNLQLLNQGIGGYIFDELSLDETLPFAPDIITIAYGSNDYKKIDSLDEIKENIKKYMSRIHKLYPQKTVYVITPIWRGDLDNEEKIQKMHTIRSTISKYATENEFHVIEGMSLTPHIKEYYMDEYLHPNAMGFEAMAKNILAQM